MSELLEHKALLISRFLEALWAEKEWIRRGGWCEGKGRGHIRNTGLLIYPGRLRARRVFHTRVKESGYSATLD